MKVTEIILTSIVMIIIDAFYLSLMSNYFNALVNKIQGSPIQFKLSGAIACYILLVLGLNYFIIQENKSLLSAFLFGIVIYGVYETTNYTIINKWEKTAVIMDTLWGGVLFATTTGIVYKLRRML
jgi:uncharacterized membrane protein